VDPWSFGKALLTLVYRKSSGGRGKLGLYFAVGPLPPLHGSICVHNDGAVWLQHSSLWHIVQTSRRSALAADFCRIRRLYTAPRTRRS